jgi:hypothetical protein
VETIGHLIDFLRVRPEPEAEQVARQARRAEAIEKLARAIVARRLEVPAALFLELNRPIGFLFSQAAFFARPFLAFFLPTADVEAAAEALDDPRALDHLIARISQITEEAGK